MGALPTLPLPRFECLRRGLLVLGAPLSRKTLLQLKALPPSARRKRLCYHLHPHRLFATLPRAPIQASSCLQLPISCPGSSLWAPQGSGLFRERPSGALPTQAPPPPSRAEAAAQTKETLPLLPLPHGGPLRWGWTLHVPRGPQGDEGRGRLPGLEPI